MSTRTWLGATERRVVEPSATRRATEQQRTQFLLDDAASVRRVVDQLTQESNRIAARAAELERIRSPRQSAERQQLRLDRARLERELSGVEERIKLGQQLLAAEEKRLGIAEKKLRALRSF